MCRTPCAVTSTFRRIQAGVLDFPLSEVSTHLVAIKFIWGQCHPQQPLVKDLGVLVGESWMCPSCVCWDPKVLKFWAESDQPQPCITAWHTKAEESTKAQAISLIDTACYSWVHEQLWHLFSYTLSLGLFRVLQNIQTQVFWREGEKKHLLHH